MARIRFFHHCKIVVLSVVIVAAAAAVCGLFWLNQKGFGGEWGDRITAELADRGLHAEFQTARYSPLRGILVRDAVFYTDEAHTQVFARIPDLRIDIDRGKALRGELLLRQLVMRDADIDIPLISTPEAPTVAKIRKLSGNVTIDRQGRFILRNGSGQIAGMLFKLDAELDEFDLRLLTTRGKDTDDITRANFVHNLFAELSSWAFPESAPPTLDLRLTGNFTKPSTLRTSFSIDAPELTRNNYTMEQAYVAGEFLGRHLTLDTFQFSDGAGQLTGRADYDLRSRDGRYELQSSIHLSRMLRTCFDNHSLDDIVSARAPKIIGDGTFGVAPDGSVRVGAVGTLKIPEFRFLGTSFQGLQTEFSWQNGDIYLRDLQVSHENGALSGRVLIQADTIRYSADSTLPISVFNPFIAPESGLAKIINRCTFHQNSRVHLVADGSIPRSNLKEWSSTGTADLANVAYRGVPLKSLRADYSMTLAEHIYSNIEATFDYSAYVLRRRHGGPNTAVVRAERISHDRATHLTHLVKLRGTAWPAPVLRMFAPKAADHIETAYRFRKPPTFTTTGTVGHLDTVALTDVKTRLIANGRTHYTFLDHELDLDQVTANVRYLHRRVEVSKLKMRTFDGPVEGNVEVTIKPGKRSGFSGGIHWTHLPLASIANTFGFAKANQGYVTGRFDFKGAAGDIRSLNGTGAIGLERGHLFFVPVFGPLSGLLGEIVGDKRASHEEARDASCTFAIKDGVWHTRDFLTSTPSTVFTGEGTIDLQHKSIDMTVRMNARGLLGLITLPLRPFNGLFQFRGQGLLKNPSWKNAPFVPPRDGRNDPIFRTPGRAVIVPER